MAKGDDVKAKKKNKALRKKFRKDPSSVTARVAALIAAKKRRQSGKRRQCQGMCFSLPTPEDPFNEKLGKEDTSMRRIKKPRQLNNKESVEDVGNRPQKKRAGADDVNSVVQEAKVLKQMDVDDRDWKGQTTENSGCPSKFLCNCLNSMQYSLVGDGELNEDKPLFANSWGVEFWKSYSRGKDILDNSKSSSTVQKISWIASTAADSISRQEKEQIPLSSPFMLYLVPSQEKAIKVRSVCKPLKVFGIHTVSLHPGAAVEHQVSGLKSCDPEFLIATPERLWELLSLKAIDISVVSLLVVDAMDSLSNYLEIVKCIRDAISGNPQTVVFQGHCSRSSVQAVHIILREPFLTLSLDESESS